MAFLTDIYFFTYFNLTLLCLLIVFFFYCGNEKKLKLRRFASTFPGPKTIFYFGNALNFMLHPEDTSNMLYDYIKKYGSRFRLWIGEQLYIVLSDIDDIEEVLGGNKFINKGDDFYDIFGRIFGIATFSAAGMAWKRSRKILLPTFKANILKDYIDIMNSETNKMVENWKPLIKNCTTFNISEYLRILTFNVICKSLFDLEQDVSRNEISIFFDKHEKHMTDCSNLMFQTKLFRKINQILSRKEFEEIENKMRLPYTKVLLENKLKQNPNSETENDEKNRKFIKYLQDDTFSEKEKKEEIIGYTAAGTEPLSFTMSFTFLMLGIHEEIQEKVHRELVGIFGNSDRDATEEDMKRMSYMEQVINEVMRHFPIAPFLFRATSETIKLNDLTLPAGTSLLINILGLHKDSRYFPEPDSFNPEHFSRENFKKLRKGCFVPFGRGPRICIAKEFAMYQMKITLSAILRRYRIHTSAKKENIMLSYAFISNNVNGFQISLSERK